MSNIIVTGGAGFIGSHIAEKLAAEDNRVVIVDDLSTGKMENLDELLGKGNVELVRGSITDLDLLQNTFKGIDYVFHQAALARVPYSVEDPLTTTAVNVNGTLNVLLAARDNHVRKVVYAASSSAYGDTEVMPEVETLAPNPMSPYALTKLAGEYYCTIFQALYGLPTVSLRYFNVYGPKQDPTSQYATAIPAFIDRVLRGEPPIVYGDGEQSRDFTFIEDVVSANLLAARSDASGVYNIGNGQSTSINRLIELILKHTGKDIKPIYKPVRAGDPRRTLADISRAATFGWKPQWDLDAGLEKTVQAFRQ
jgi:UDP-glucose 4-epimerase